MITAVWEGNGKHNATPLANIMEKQFSERRVWLVV